MDAALVVQVDVPGGVAALAASDAGVEVKPFPGVAARYLVENKMLYNFMANRCLSGLEWRGTCGINLI